MSTHRVALAVSMKPREDVEHNGDHMQQLEQAKDDCTKHIEVGCCRR